MSLKEGQSRELSKEASNSALKATIKQSRIYNFEQVNLMGVIVGKNENRMIIDDGTGQMAVRSISDFYDNNAGIGDVVIVIGRLSKVNDEKHVLAQIIKKVDPLWLEVRKKEIKGGSFDKSVLKEKQTIEKEQEMMDPGEAITSLIKKLDKGPGVEINELKNISAIDSCEAIIERLIRDGEIYEVGPGRIKILE